MADAKKPDLKPPAAAAEPAGRASESGDPAVHQLLAQRQAAVMNDDQDLLVDVDEQLVALGFAEYRH